MQSIPLLPNRFRRFEQGCHDPDVPGGDTKWEPGNDGAAVNWNGGQGSSFSTLFPAIFLFFYNRGGAALCLQVPCLPIAGTPSREVEIGLRALPTNQFPLESGHFGPLVFLQTSQQEASEA
eukprot:EG_transcript_29825